MNKHLFNSASLRNKHAMISKCFHYSLIEAINIISSHRYAEKKFSSKQISSDTLFKILHLAQLAPSAFNLQPYKLIIIKSSETKDLLSTAMLGGNSKTLISAPINIVVLADQDPLQNLDKLMKLELDNGKDPAYINSLPSTLNLLFNNNSFITRNIRKVALHLLSPIKPAPKLSDNNHSWAIKNAMLMAQQLMIAATAYGIRSGPMEGYDERRVRYILNIPDERYSIPLIINLGYSADPNDKLLNFIQDNNDNQNMNLPVKTRFSLEDICYSEKYGNQIKLNSL